MFKMYRFYKCMILKVTDRFSYRYFICSELKKHVSSSKALILRLVHVPVHQYMNRYLYRYINTCKGTDTSVHVPVHALMYMYMCRKVKIYMISKKNRVHGRGHEKVLL